MTEASTSVKNKGGPGRNNPASDAARVAQLAGWLRLFVAPGQVTELRVPKARQKHGGARTVSGFFDGDHLDQMAAEALRLEASADGVYFVLNPVVPALLARRCNRVDIADQGDGTSDKDIVRRHWLLIDADPVRPAKISSTDEEKRWALDAVMAVYEHLRGRDWPVPVLADSGNGYHLLYRIDLPTEDGGVVERCLKALAARFDSDRVKIDQSVFNPSRITKLYGTLSGKGDDTPDRPHRRSQILEAP